MTVLTHPLTPQPSKGVSRKKCVDIYTYAVYKVFQKMKTVCTGIDFHKSFVFIFLNEKLELPMCFQALVGFLNGFNGFIDLYPLHTEIAGCLRPTTASPYDDQESKQRPQMGV